MRQDYYQDYYFLERYNWWFLARKKILKDQVKKLVEDKIDIRILNVGAAFGDSTIMLQEFGEVTSLEYNKVCCDFVKQELGLDFKHGSILELPFKDNEFDLVCAFDVVEHVQEDALAIQELHRVCKPDGYIFTTVPTFKFMWSDHDYVNNHVRRYTMKGFLNLFDSRIAKIHFKSYFNFWLFLPVAAFRVISSFLKKFRKVDISKSDMGRINGGIVSTSLRNILESETHLLKLGISFPVGVSLMVISRKFIS